MRAGKLTSEELNSVVLNKIESGRKEVVLSAALSEDCAAISCEDVLLLTTDPITATGRGAGRLAIDVCANDVAAGGGEPFCCLLTIIAPIDATTAEVAEVMNEATARAKALNVDIVGGHTEFSDAVNRTVVSCTMVGRCKRIVRTAGSRLGDSLVLTKTAGIEGTYVLAHDYADRLNLTAEEREEAAGYVDKLSVLTEGRIATDYAHAMHDVTEGGVLGAACEMSESAGLGVELYLDKIPVAALTKKVCDGLGIDVYGLLSSGSMLIATDDAEGLIVALTKAGVAATEIGRLTNGARVAITKDGEINLAVTADEIYKAGRV